MGIEKLTGNLQIAGNVNIGGRFYSNELNALELNTLNTSLVSVYNIIYSKPTILNITGTSYYIQVHTNGAGYAFYLIQLGTEKRWVSVDFVSGETTLYDIVNSEEYSSNYALSEEVADFVKVITVSADTKLSDIYSEQEKYKAIILKYNALLFSCYIRQSTVQSSTRYQFEIESLLNEARYVGKNIADDLTFQSILIDRSFRKDYVSIFNMPNTPPQTGAPLIAEGLGSDANSANWADYAQSFTDVWVAKNSQNNRYMVLSDFNIGNYDNNCVIGNVKCELDINYQQFISFLWGTIWSAGTWQTLFTYDELNPEYDFSYALMSIYTNKLINIHLSDGSSASLELDNKDVTFTTIEGYLLPYKFLGKLHLYNDELSLDYDLNCELSFDYLTTNSFTIKIQALPHTKENEFYAPEYNSSESYVVGDVCSYLGVLYVCNTATTGSFDETKWDKTTLSAWVESKHYSTFSGSYNDLTDKPTIPTNADYVDKTTNQTVAGIKTFSSGEIVIGQTTLTESDLIRLLALLNSQSSNIY